MMWGVGVIIVYLLHFPQNGVEIFISFSRHFRERESQLNTSEMHNFGDIATEDTDHSDTDKRLYDIWDQITSSLLPSHVDIKS